MKMTLKETKISTKTIYPGTNVEDLKLPLPITGPSG